MNNTQQIIGNIATDDRGTVRFVNDFNFNGVKRFYQVSNHRSGFIRAWHGHMKEAKYVYVAKGTALVAAVPMEDMLAAKESGILANPDVVQKAVLSANKPTVLFIPAGDANGFKTLEEGTIVQFFSTSTLEQSPGDDIRFDYNLVNVWGEDYR